MGKERTPPQAERAENAQKELESWRKSSGVSRRQKGFIHSSLTFEEIIIDQKQIIWWLQTSQEPCHFAPGLGTNGQVYLRLGQLMVPKRDEDDIAVVGAVG